MHQTTKWKCNTRALAHAEAFDRRASAVSPQASPVKLDGRDMQLTERLVRHVRTTVPTALLAVPGLGSSEPVRRAVLVA